MHRRAFLLIRHDPHYRRAAFEAGLRACGYEIHGTPRGPVGPADVLVIWNRYGRNEQFAQQFTASGAQVLVVENGLWGRDWNGDHWYSLGLDLPAAVGGGYLTGGDDTRWNGWGICHSEHPFVHWRNDGKKEVIVLQQRGIGPRESASPHGWAEGAADRLRRMTKRPVRIRMHPGERPCKPLEADLADAWCVVTWASGAALKALLLGIPVFYDYPKWCGRGAAMPVRWKNQPADWIETTYRGNVFPLMRRLAWTTYNVGELSSGAPFAALLGLPSIKSPSTTAAS